MTLWYDIYAAIYWRHWRNVKVWQGSSKKWLISYTGPLNV